MGNNFTIYKRTYRAKKLLNAQELKSLASQIIKNQVTWNQTPLCEKYEISPTLLRKGVLCQPVMK